MLLRNVSIIDTDGVKDILTGDGKIQSVTSPGTEMAIGKNNISLSFTDAIAFPGLVNSHDHLDFNLFPQTGNRIYNNYREWGNDIHGQNKEEISRVRQIPLHLRIQWGLYKNLLNGVTTVVNHGEELEIDHELITVFFKSHSLHSPAFEKKWKWKIIRPFTGRYLL